MTKTTKTNRCPSSRSGWLTTDVTTDGPITALIKAGKNYVSDRANEAVDSFTMFIKSPYGFYKGLTSGPRHGSAAPAPVSGGSAAPYGGLASRPSPKKPTP